MGSIVFPAARVLVAWLEQHGGNLDGVRALGKGEIQYLIFNFQYSILDGEKQFEWGYVCLAMYYLYAWHSDYCK